MDTGYKKPRTKRRKRKPATRPPGRPKGSLDKATIEKQLKAQRAMLRSANFKLATEHMDTQIGKLEGLTDLLYPFTETGTVKRGRDSSLYFQAFALYRDFLSMRAPFQSPKLSSVAVTPMGQQRPTTHVSVTILGSDGAVEYSDAPNDSKLIEHAPMEQKDEEAA